jgi:hypothetical protein
VGRCGRGARRAIDKKWEDDGVKYVRPWGREGADLIGWREVDLGLIVDFFFRYFVVCVTERAAGWVSQQEGHGLVKCGLVVSWL